MPEYTPTQQRLLTVLSDGMAHTRPELWACLNDENSCASNLTAHLSILRRKLRPIGQDILCELNGGIHYRHVRLLSSPYKG